MPRDTTTRRRTPATDPRPGKSVSLYTPGMDGLPIDTTALRDLCRRWKIAQLGVIGSVLRDDFGPASDVDVVLTFLPDSTWDLFDVVRLREELAAMFGRSVDVIEEPAVRNPYMQASIRRTKRVLYAA